MRLTETAQGVYIIMPTPFAEDGALDLDSIPRMIEFFLARGVDGLTVLGVMGEATKLTEAEARRVAGAVIQRVAGRVPVVVGVSSPGFAAMEALAAAVMDEGAAAVMVAPPPGLRTDEAVIGYFEGVAQALGDIPFVLQDFPQGSGVHVGPSAIRRIVDAQPSCVMLKHEDWPGLDKLSRLRDASASGGMRRISILTGNGGLFLPEELRRGADGVMTGFAFPEMMVGVMSAHRAGDADRAADGFDAYLPLARYEQQPGLGLAVRKFILARRGAIASATLRSPRTRLGPREIAEIEFLLARQARRLAELGATAEAR